MNILKQSTAATIKLGPFVDDTDGKTAETALTIGQADIRLSKNGGDIAQTHNATGATHDELGYYDIPLDTTDTGTLGRLRVLVSKAGALPVWQDFVVVTANVYDSMFSTDKLDVAVVEMATDVLTAAAVKADAVTKIQSGLATPTNITAGTITTVTNLTNLPTMPTDWLTAAGLKADAVTEIQSGLATAAALDAVDNFIDTEVAAILAAVDTEVAAIKAKTDNLPASPAAVGSAMTLTAAYDKAKDDVLTPLGVVDGIVDAIKVQTDKIPATPASAGEYTANIGAIKAKTDNIPAAPLTAQQVWEYVTRELTSQGAGGATAQEVWEYATRVLTAGTNLPTANDISNAVWSQSDVYALDEKGFQLETLYNDLINGGRLDLLVDAIKARTDQLTFTVANKVDATATTDTSNIAGDVWSYAKRTLTHPSVSAEEPEDSNTLILYRDADIAIELTDLTIPAGAKKYIFTIKDNLDGGDDQAVLQASYAIDGSEVETNTLVYINSAVPPALTNPVTFTLTETNITIDLTAEAAALLPRYERGYLNWDLKLVTDAAVTIVLQGLAQIIGTSTRAIE